VYIGGAWMVITLLPYSFLTYMPRVPSRHTYLASAATAWFVAAALLELKRRSADWKKPWLVPAAATVIVLHQCGIHWITKHYQHEQRARPTEELVRVGSNAGGTIYANCCPYAPLVGELALQMRLSGESKPTLVVGPLAATYPGSINFCNEVADGVHFGGEPTGY